MPLSAPNGRGTKEADENNQSKWASRRRVGGACAAVVDGRQDALSGLGTPTIRPLSLPKARKCL